ncbi:precorrin-6A/cobalt-precorrin-6A reductase [Desulfonauticus submarinus]|uniref:Precorrin-6A/cobalt-precorrin-6A reductase n=1 Tax=Desulfonauticus submarinus TaxID=206665 RepID=A0A1H0BUI2_9BACT|nr:precorrin-6A/cobalt-precorrin-6A reductase [Desulfonauticus submarinus]SDN49272.1 precorrin-6A/cobalt-precorrin-6A reductase [Desulfonauticus submarinus]
MKTVLILGGTSETRDVLRLLNQRKIRPIVSTLTDWDLKLPLNIKRIEGPLTLEKFVHLLQTEDIQTVIDITHPFACRISELAFKVCKEFNIPLLSYIRPEWLPRGEHVFLVADHIEAKHLLLKWRRPFLLTIGLKNLLTYRDCFAANIPFWIKVLEKSYNKVISLGINKKNILPLPPRLSIVEWERIILPKNIQVLVTKSSGKQGGLEEKDLFTKKHNIRLIIVKRPVKKIGTPFDRLENLVEHI